MHNCLKFVGFVVKHRSSLDGAETEQQSPSPSVLMRSTWSFYFNESLLSIALRIALLTLARILRFFAFVFCANEGAVS